MAFCKNLNPWVTWVLEMHIYLGSVDVSGSVLAKHVSVLNCILVKQSIEMYV